MHNIPPYQRRIMGIETEYGLNPLSENLLNPSLFDGLRQCESPVNKIIMAAGNSGFSSFGGRLYADQGKNMELATPECVTGAGLLAAHFAGEKIVRSVVSELYPAAEVYKRTADRVMNTRGEHENFLTGPDYHPFKLVDYLLPHLISRTIVVGPGMIKDRKYVLDQKVWKLGDNPVSSHSTVEGKKPFIIDREEHFSPDGMHRLQIASGSHNMFAFPELAKMLGTSLVLRLCEQGMYPKRLLLDENPVTAAQRIARDTDLRAKIRLVRGRRYTAAQVQLELAEAFMKLVDKGEIPKDEQFTARLLLEITNDLNARELDPWKKHIEWLAKMSWLEGWKEKENAKWSSPRIMEREIKWHRLNNDGVVARLRKAGCVALMPSDQEINNAVTTPPDPTRARKRGRIIKNNPGAGQIGWDYWTVNGRRVDAPNPYHSS